MFLHFSGERRGNALAEESKKETQLKRESSRRRYSAVRTIFLKSPRKP